MQPFIYMVSPHGDSNIALPVYQDMTPVLQEYPNSAENIFGTGATNSKLMRTSAPKIVDGPTKKVRKKSKKITEIEVAGESDRCVHDNSGEAFALNAGGSTCDMVGLLDHLERTDSVRMESSSQCFEQLDNLEEQMDDFQHALSIEQVHAPAEIDILKKPSDTKAKIWGEKKNSDLTLPVNHTLSKEDTKHNTFFGSSGKSSASKARDSQGKGLGKLKSEKGSCRLLHRALGKGGKLTMDGNQFVVGPRTILYWLIEMGSVSVKDTVQFRNPKNDAVVKDGWVTREGILCNCCSKILSVSEFKAHAGFKHQRPPLSLFLQSDKPYTLCQLQAWSTEYKVRKSRMQVMGAEVEDENDDTCALCGDGGDLVCCDNCPSTYHQSCLSAQELPEGSWYCPNCVCMSCGDVADGKSGDVADGKEASNSLSVFKCSQCRNKYHETCIKRRLPCNVELGSSEWFCGESCQEELPEGSWYCRNCVCMTCGDVAEEKESLISLAVLECSQCGHKYHETCIKRRVPCNVEVGSREWFCEETCQEVYMGFCSRVGVVNHIGDGFSWTILRRSHVGQKDSSKEKLALTAECNAKLAISLTLMEECFDQMVDPRTGIDMIPHVIYNWGVHGARVAEVPFIATCNKHRRQGMARRLINSVEKLLMSLKVKILVISAIPILVKTWTLGFGFKPIEDEEKQQLENVNLMKFPGTVLLKKNLHED